MKKMAKTGMSAVLLILALAVLQLGGCRLPLDVDVNVDRGPDLQSVCTRYTNGAPFAGVTVKVHDPLNHSTTNAQGTATNLVYKDARSCRVTYTWWTLSPMTERSREVKISLRKGLTVYRIRLQDDPYRTTAGKITPGAELDTLGIQIEALEIDEVSGDTTTTPLNLTVIDGMVYAQ